MLRRDLAHDGQAEAGAVDLGAERAVERLEHQFALGYGDARAGVLHLQHHDLPERVVDHPHRDGPAGRRVLQRVVDQVADQLAQQQRMAEYLRALRVACQRRVARAFIAEVDAFFERARDEVAHRLGREPGQVHHLALRHLLLVFGPRHREQLVDHVRGALA